MAALEVLRFFVYLVPNGYAKKEKKKPTITEMLRTIQFDAATIEQKLSQPIGEL